MLRLYYLFRRWFVKATFIVLTLVLLIYFLLANYALNQTVLKQCYRRRDDSSINYLIDVMDADRMPVPGRSIFFYITTCIESGQIELKPRYDYLQRNLQRIIVIES